MAEKPYGTFTDSGRSKRHRNQSSGLLEPAAFHVSDNAASMADQAATPSPLSSFSSPRRGFARSCLTGLRQNLLLVLLLAAILVGLGLGLSLRGVIAPGDAAAIRYLGFPGELLMRMLKLLILPLIVSSLVAAMCGLDASASSKLGARALLYYLVTTLVAMAIGMVLVYAIQPGAGGGGPASTDATPTADPAGDSTTSAASSIDPLLDLIRNMFPENLIEACFRSTQTQVINFDFNGTLSAKSVVEKVDGSMNILGLVVYSIVLGAMLVRLGPAGKPVADLMISLQEATMLMINLAIWFSPVGILSLVAAELVKMTDPVTSLRQLGLYLVTVLAGLTLHGLGVLPLVYLAVTRRNPVRFLAGTAQAMATAFGTSSSSATLPITYKCLEETNKLDKRVTRFILPIGATVNMNGTALYEAVAPIFIAQMNGISLDFGQLIAIALTATCAAVGAAGIPQAGLVTMVVVLNAVGLPTNDIAKILAVDWLLDRFRTMINVLGDCFGAGIVEHLSRKDLAPQRHRLRSVDTEPLLGGGGNVSCSSA